MDRHAIPSLALVLACACAAPAAPRATVSPRAPRVAAPHIDLVDEATAVRALEERLVALAGDDGALREELAQSAARFPEGDVLPAALVVAGLAMGSEPPGAAAEAWLAVLTERVEARIGGLPRALEGYGRHGTDLALLTWALGLFQRRACDGARDARHGILAQLLLDALNEHEPGAPIASYPDQVWPIDTAVALAALRLRGVDAPVRAHLAWLERAGMAPDGLPFARVDTHAPMPPRGSDVSWRIALLRDLAPEAARALYARYVELRWRDTGLMAGFAEWPRDAPGGPDVDSGPLLDEGIGATASAFGIAAARAAGDEPRRERLVAQLRLGRAAVEEAHGGRIGGLPIDARWVTGSLMGDATLFYALRYRPLTEIPSCAPSGCGACERSSECHSGCCAYWEDGDEERTYGGFLDCDRGCCVDAAPEDGTGGR